MSDTQTGGRKGTDRRLTFTQTPYTAEFSEKLSAATDISRADLYNTAMSVLSIVLGVFTADGEYVIQEGDLYREDPALKVLLANILISLRQRETKDAGSTP